MRQFCREPTSRRSSLPAAPRSVAPVGTDTSIVEVLDGLIISGGSDVGPEQYGAQPHRLTRAQPARDVHDIALTKAALDAEVPLFAICRGAQILNVAMGGSLIQHIPDVNPEADYQPASGVFGNVEFTTAPGSISRACWDHRPAHPVITIRPWTGSRTA
ncbi:putative glutamine amidotransferase Rv2859c [Arthrobacter sp. Hiyo4]|nr:putative glutamine amidotransferase Rv2859c [Arthrobacter sp. Hiyo4]